jgi:transcriptional regulator with XRE-family HTH domain
MAALGLTTASLARASGVGRTSLRRVLDGSRTRMRHESVHRLAVALGVTVDHIMTNQPQRGARR